MVSFKFWKKDKTAGRIRGPDGKFMGVSGDQAGVPEEMAGFTKTLTGLTKTLNTVSQFENALTSHTLQKLEAQRQYQDLQADMMEGVEAAVDGDDDLMTYAVKMLIPHLMQGMGNKSPQTEGPGWGNPVPVPQVPVPTQTVNRELESPLDSFNNALKQIDLIPAKLMTEGRVEQFARQQGIDYPVLESVVKKLSGVMVK